MRKKQGFTLIEILIALVIFAIIASITSSTLYYAFTTRTRVNEQSARLSQLQFAISFIQQDFNQVTTRAIRSTDLHLSPAFIGESRYVEFTRAGNVNPQSIEKRSTLKRVAWICQNNTLRRRTWPSLDTVNSQIYEDKLLVDHLTHCHFAYLNRHLHTFSEWHAGVTKEKQTKELLPKAIQINLSSADLGEFNLLIPIPGALYHVSS